jgi:hypothetical protein
MSKAFRICIMLGAVALVATSVPPAQAALNFLIDDNSVAQIDPQTQGGLFSWTVDGVDHLFQEWFWIRSGNNPEVSLDTAWVSEVPTPNTLVSTFNNGLWNIVVTYALDGGAGGSRVSKMSETIVITNVSGGVIDDLHFFEYTDFDLNETSGSDTGYLIGPNSIGQSDSGTLAAVAALPGFDRWEIGLFPSIISSLNDGLPTTLANAASPLSGDVTFAMQWDLPSLADGANFTISKEKTIQSIPEPTSLALLAGLLGLVAAGLPACRRAARTAV